MKKKVLSVLLVAAMAMSMLTGCGSKPAGNDAQSAASSEASKETEDAPAPAEAVQEPQKAPEDPAPKKNTKKVEKTAPAEAEPSPESADEAAPAAPAEVTEDFRITVRKQLAALNKKRGYNRAAELINEQTGKGKLTEVALADLPKLMEAAKEETNAD
jgi:ferritin-like metal-binding protein YciE